MAYDNPLIFIAVLCVPMNGSASLVLDTDFFDPVICRPTVSDLFQNVNEEVLVHSFNIDIERGDAIRVGILDSRIWKSMENVCIRVGNMDGVLDYHVLVK